MTAAGILVLSILNYIFGLFNLFIPAILGVFVYRQGAKAGMVVSLSAAFLGSLLLFTPLIALEIMIIGILGVVVGVGLREKFSFTSLLLIGVVASAIALLLLISSFTVISGFNIVETYLELWESTSRETLQIWEGLGLSEEMITEYQVLLELLPSLFQVMLPIIFVGLGLIATLLTLVIARIVLIRLGSPEAVPKIPPFVQWSFPPIFTWGFIIGKLLVVLSYYYPYELLQAVTLNIDTFFSYAFLLQGVAIAWHFLDEAGLHKFFRFILLFFIFAASGLLRNSVMLFGVLDSWFDFRKLNKQKEEQK